MKRQLLALLFAGLCPAAARQPASPADLWVWRTASDARISADGAWVVYVEGWNDRSANAAYSNLWLQSSDGRRRATFTEGKWRDYSPRWSPDGTRIAWISDRGRLQIWMRRVGGGAETVVAGGSAAAVAGGAAEATAEGELEPTALAWSPDGTSIAFLARVGIARAAPAWAPPEILARLSRPRAFSTRIFVVPAEGGGPRRLSGADLDFVGDPAWMPNGQSIVCAERGGEIFALRVADGAARQLTRSGGINREPAPSPDGSKIAYTSAAAGPRSYAVRRLNVMNADGSRGRLLAGALDRDARHPQWSNESRTVYFVADDRGATHVYAARNDGTARQLTDRAERLRGFSLADNGRAVTVRSSRTEGSAVFTFTTDAPAGGWTLADVDQQILATREWGAVEEMPFESAGKRMQAWLVKPAQFDAGHEYPLLVDVGDAPPRMWGAEFPLRAHLFAARGFVVMLTNPRGTPGYGEEFGDLLATQIPADPAEDLLRALDAAVAQEFIDSKRVAVAGGITATWLLGHSDRLSAVVTRHPIVDWLTYPGAARWMRALPWDDPGQYVKHSPIFSAGNFKAPTLVLADGDDPQSEELYRALQVRKVESELVRLGGGPAAQVQELEAMLAWLDMQK